MQTSVKSLQFKHWVQRWAALPLATLFCASSAFAADPFRVGVKARPMGPSLQSAFEDFFRYGKYQSSTPKLIQAQSENPSEPLVYTLLAGNAYQNRKKEEFLTTLPKIREASQALATKDAARSHLYRGIAQGLEGYFLKDTVAGIPKALTYASSMLLEIDKAHQLAPNDPEVNLFVGFVNMVLSKRDDALKNFEKAGPPYLALRGKALVYRDLKDYANAQRAVDQAIAAAPENPELFYLKGQIFALQRQPVEAVAQFDRALKLGDQLPEGTLKQISKERNTQFSRISTPSS